MTNDDLTEIGWAIRALRNEQGFSQETFAKHVNINRSYMGRIERGEQNISALNLIKIAKGLGVNVGVFFKRV